MMYRSNWGTKKNQECIIAIDLYRDKFDELLHKTVLTSPESSVYSNSAQWERAFEETNVYCQWDPDKNINGNPINRAAIQIGLKGSALENLLAYGICRIQDMSPLVIKWREQRRQGNFNAKDLPTEKIYPISDKEIRKRLNMD